MLDVEMICPDLLFDTNLSTSENLNVEVANFLSKEAIYRANSVGELPTIGSKVILYVINNKDLYVWNTQTNEYDLLNFSQAHVGDGLITVFQNGAAVGSFSLNQDRDADIELTTPTKVSELDNDSNYISDNEKYIYSNGEIVKNPNYEEIFKKRKNSEKTSKIIEKLNELDSKRIRAVCENQIKDSQTGETWLEYYNSQANELRNELQAIE